MLLARLGHAMLSSSTFNSNLFIVSGSFVSCSKFDQSNLTGVSMLVDLLQNSHFL